MKKLFKSMLIACLAIVAICPVVFTGCAKTYTVTISVQNEGGNVYATNEESKKLEGENNVKEGESFEYYVKPLAGYTISKVEVDGKEYTEEYNKNGCYLSVLEVTGNHNVKIWFEAVDVTVQLICSDGVLTTTTVKYGSLFDLNNYGGAVNNGWYINNGGTTVYLYEGDDNRASNTLTIRYTGTVQIKTDTKTIAEIQALIDAAGNN